MPRLTPDDYLKLHQLRLRAWADQAQLINISDGPTQVPEAPVAAPGLWELTRGLTLQPWQKAAADEWFKAARRGTIKVVTGAGKTVLALAIAERLQNTVDPDLRVAIVVPTIVLMHQWRDALLERSNLPPAWIGRLGGGYKDDFKGPVRILISVLASACKELPRIVSAARAGEHLLLIADECHRAGAPEQSAVLATGRAHSLGLSATPERPEEEDVDAEDGDLSSAAPPDAPGYDASLLGKEIGPIVYEMTFAQAVELDVLPHFELHHFGLPLNEAERERHEKLSRTIREANTELRAEYSRRRSGPGSFFAWCRRLMSGGREISSIAARYVQETSRRKQLIYAAESRKAATLALLRSTLAARADGRAILFHESIEQVVELFDLLVREGLPAVMEHSKLPTELREKSLDLFRTGAARVIVSAKSLIEGFNVPAADLGIIVASSSSPRQRIQSIGRVLRKHRTAIGEEKTARLCILYVRGTSDESIYERKDWSEFAGVDRNRYFTWDPPAEPAPQEGPPREAIPDEAEIDVAELVEGGPYPGRYEGADFSCDSLKNVKSPDGAVAVNPQGVPEAIVQLKSSGGRFKVTPGKHAVLVHVPEGGGWKTVFVRRLAEPFRFEAEAPSIPMSPAEIAALEPGAEYRGPVQGAQPLLFKQKRGGLIAKSVKGGEVHASGSSANKLVHTLRLLTQERGPIPKLFLNDALHAFWRESGAARFICALDEPLAFPSDEREKREAGA